MLLGFSHNVEKSSGIVAHFVTQFAQGDKGAAACGHGDAVFASIEDGKLNEQYLEFANLFTQALNKGLHARDIPVMIGTKNVDNFIGATVVFMQMIRRIVSKISRVAIFANKYTVFVIAKIGGAKPEGSVFFIGAALLFHN